MSINTSLPVGGQRPQVSPRSLGRSKARTHIGKLAFFPWLVLTDEVRCGDFHLLPYDRGKAPYAGADQRLVDAVLRPYVDATGHPVSRATILTHAQQSQCLAEFDDSLNLDLFLFADILAFAGLAARKFFSFRDYSNRDVFRLVIQSFQDPDRGSLLTTRRRDGTTSLFVTGSVYRVAKPDHVPSGSAPIDQSLLKACVHLLAQDEWPAIFQAITLFNEANTDRLESRAETEAILAYAAIEQILGEAGAKPTRVAKAFSNALKPSHDLPREEWVVGSTRTGRGRLAPKAGTLREAWLLDFAASRGSLAHGHAAGQYPAVWNQHEHLLMAAVALPLLVKLKLGTVATYPLFAEDHAAVEAFEELLNTRHLGDPSDDDDYEHAWPDIISRARIRAWIDQAVGESGLFKSDGAAS